MPCIRPCSTELRIPELRFVLYCVIFQIDLSSISSESYKQRNCLGILEQNKQLRLTNTLITLSLS